MEAGKKEDMKEDMMVVKKEEKQEEKLEDIKQDLMVVKKEDTKEDKKEEKKEEIAEDKKAFLMGLENVLVLGVNFFTKKLRQMYNGKEDEEKAKESERKAAEMEAAQRKQAQELEESMKTKSRLLQEKMEQEKKQLEAEFAASDASNKEEQQRLEAKRQEVEKQHKEQLKKHAEEVKQLEQELMAEIERMKQNLEQAVEDLNKQSRNIDEKAQACKKEEAELQEKLRQASEEDRVGFERNLAVVKKELEALTAESHQKKADIEEKIKNAKDHYAALMKNTNDQLKRENDEHAALLSSTIANTGQLQTQTASLDAKSKAIINTSENKSTMAGNSKIGKANIELEKTKELLITSLELKGVPTAEVDKLAKQIVSFPLPSKKVIQKFLSNGPMRTAVPPPCSGLCIAHALANSTDFSDKVLKAACSIKGHNDNEIELPLL